MWSEVTDRFVSVTRVKDVRRRMMERTQEEWRETGGTLPGESVVPGWLDPLDIEDATRTEPESKNDVKVIR